MKELYASFRKSKWFPMITGVISIIFGILCLINPASKMESIAMYIGLAILVYGLFSIVQALMNRENKKLFITDLLLGLLLIVLAVLIFVNVELVGKYLPTVAGFAMILNGISDLFRAVVLWKNGVKSWWIGATFAVIILVLGFIFLLNPGYVGQTIGIFSGIALIISGVLGIIHFAQFKN